MEKARAAIYARKSRATNRGDSVENQIQECKDYMIRKYPDLDVEYTIYKDDGYSGKDLDRPAFQQFLRECTYRKFDYFICYKLDRLSRKMADFANTFEYFVQQDIEFVSTNEEFDMSKKTGKLMLTMISAFAEFERETIRERICDNIAVLAEKGHWLGGTTAIGYVSAANYSDNGKKYMALEKDDKYFSIAQLIYTKYLELGTLNQLADYLDKHNIRTRKEKKFTTTNLKDILSNPTYCSCDKQSSDYLKSIGYTVYVPNDEYKNYGFVPFGRNPKKDIYGKSSDFVPTVAQGIHEPVVPSETWIKIQEQLKSQKAKSFKSGLGTTSKIALLSDLLYCKRCGSKAAVTNQSTLKDGSISFTYRCSGKQKKSIDFCNAKNIPGPMLDDFIIEQIKERYSNRELLRQELKERKAELLRQSPDYEYEKSKLQEKEALELQVNTLLDSLSKAPNERVQQVILTKIDKMTADIDNLNGSINTLKYERENRISDLKNFEDIVNGLVDISKVLNDTTIEEKRKLLQSVIHRIEWDGDTIEVIMKYTKNNRNYYNKSICS